METHAFLGEDVLAEKLTRGLKVALNAPVTLPGDSFFMERLNNVKAQNCAIEAALLTTLAKLDWLAYKKTGSFTIRRMVGVEIFIFHEASGFTGYIMVTNVIGREMVSFSLYECSHVPLFIERGLIERYPANLLVPV